MFQWRSTHGNIIILRREKITNDFWADSLSYTNTNFQDYTKIMSDYHNGIRDIFPEPDNSK